MFNNQTESVSFVPSFYGQLTTDRKKTFLLENQTEIFDCD